MMSTDIINKVSLCAINGQDAAIVKIRNSERVVICDSDELIKARMRVSMIGEVPNKGRRLGLTALQACKIIIKKSREDYKVIVSL